MATLKDRKHRQDAFYNQAKKENYAARSVYKLEELDKRFKLFRRKQRVLDLGCRPGSWLQYAADRVGQGGFVVGLDREELDISLPDNAAVLVGDVLTIDPAQFTAALPASRRGCFQLIISDMAPDTSGIKFTDQARSNELFGRALDLALELGCPSSGFVGKLFMGEGFDETMKRVKQHYALAKTVRPEATRKASNETFIVALDRKPPLA